MSLDAALLRVRPVTKLFRALGDETRLRMVALLTHGELCVCHLERALGLPQPTASRHLSVLRSAGIVETRRAGSWVFYRLAQSPDTAVQLQLASLRDAFSGDEQLKQDVAALARTAGPGACP